jgi:uncharacterized membrane protein
MHEEIIDSPDVQQESPKIYSKKAIWVFTILFAPLASGFMLRQNLLDIGNRRAGNNALLVSILCTATTMVIMNTIPNAPSSLTYGLNIGWAALLSEYFFKKHFPGTDYQHKSIRKPLLICLAILIPFLVIVFYAATNGLIE